MGGVSFCTRVDTNGEGMQHVNILAVTKVVLLVPTSVHVQIRAGAAESFGNLQHISLYHQKLFLLLLFSESRAGEASPSA